MYDKEFQVLVRQYHSEVQSRDLLGSNSNFINYDVAAE